MSVVDTDPAGGNGGPPQLALVHGGRGSLIWLSTLPKGTTFLTREKGMLRFELIMFQVLETTSKSTLLLQPNYTGGPANYIWVDPIKFSHSMEPFEIFLLREEENVTGSDG